MADQGNERGNFPGQLSRSSDGVGRSDSSASAFESNQALKPFDAQSLVGQTLLDRYKIVDIVGQGAMAVVYQARQLSTNQLVAIKTLKFSDPILTKRFKREIEIHSQLRHPNIVEPIEFASGEDGRAYFVMELLRGRSIEDLFETRGRFTRVEELYEVIPQVCDALSFAHSMGIIHRDIKPANIILTIVDGKKQVEVVDFGLAKLHEDLQKITKTGQVLGSPVYMSPEQCRGDDLDQRSDIYSLSVVMYEMVTGDLPFDANNPVAMMESHCDPELVPVSIEERIPGFPGARELNCIVRKSMETEPSLRFQSVAEFKEAINAWYETVSGSENNGYFEADEFQKYMNDSGPRKEKPAPSRMHTGAFRSKSAETKKEPEKIEKSQTREVKEIPLAASELRGLVDQKIADQTKSAISAANRKNDDRFVSEKAPASARIGDIVVKALLFVIVLAAFTGGTIFLCIKFLNP